MGLRKSSVTFTRLFQASRRERSCIMSHVGDTAIEAARVDPFAVA